MSCVPAFHPTAERTFYPAYGEGRRFQTFLLARNGEVRPLALFTASFRPVTW